jgi:hypothetical protein
LGQKWSPPNKQFEPLTSHPISPYLPQPREDTQAQVHTSRVGYHAIPETQSRYETNSRGTSSVLLGGTLDLDHGISKESLMPQGSDSSDNEA